MMSSLIIHHPDELLATGQHRPTFLIATQNEDLLTEQEQLDRFVIG
jgi:hypothetical protein